MHGRRWFRLIPGLAALALVAAACSSNSTSQSSAATSEASQMPMASGSEPMPMASGSGQMMMQPGAENMHVRITSPAPGFVLTGNTLTLDVQVSGYKPACAYAGKDDMKGIGHYHVLLDGALINMFCTPTAQVSMQNVTPGQHTIEAVPAQDDHTEIEANAQKMAFTYKPANPLPVISAPGGTGTPSIQILEPHDGATLSGAFTVKVTFQNFQPSCGLMGKPDVPGYGHWHVNIDSMSGPMMGMGTMLGMSCTATFHGSTVGLQPGTTHTLFALLTDNGHAPLGVFDKIDFTVGQ